MPSGGQMNFAEHLYTTAVNRQHPAAPVKISGLKPPWLPGNPGILQEAAKNYSFLCTRCNTRDYLIISLPRHEQASVQQTSSLLFSYKLAASLHGPSL